MPPFVRHNAEDCQLPYHHARFPGVPLNAVIFLLFSRGRLGQKEKMEARKNMQRRPSRPIADASQPIAGTMTTAASPGRIVLFRMSKATHKNCRILLFRHVKVQMPDAKAVRSFFFCSCGLLPVIEIRGSPSGVLLPCFHAFPTMPLSKPIFLVYTPQENS